MTLTNLSCVAILGLVLLAEGALAVGDASGDIRDPTAPLVPVVDALGAGGPTLSAIFMRGKAATAVINGKRVKVGDRLGEHTVTAIHPGEVHLAGAAPLVLALYPRVIDNSQTERQP